MPSPSVWHIHGCSIHFDFFLWIQELLRNHLLTTPESTTQRGWGVTTFTAELPALRRSLGKEVILTIPVQIPLQWAPSKSSSRDHCHPLSQCAKSPLARWLSTEGWPTGLRVPDARGLCGTRKTACLRGSPQLLLLLWDYATVTNSLPHNSTSTPFVFSLETIGQTEDM